LRVDFSAGSIAMPELGRSFDVQAVEIVPAGPNPISMNVDGEWPDFAGSFCVYRQSDRKGAVVNTLDVEEYLISVVAAETPATFHAEAFRAQAVASRTYAWYQKRTAPAGRRWDLMATEGSQVYSGLPSREARRLAAAGVESTSGVVCTWDSLQGERIFCTYFSSTCGGHTQAAGPVKSEQTIPPLAGNVQCGYCTHSPSFTWGPTRFTKKTVTDRLRLKYPRFQELGQIEEIKVIDTTPHGRPVRLRLADSRGRGIELEAENFRLTVDPTGRILRSTCFKVQNEAARFVFSDGKGFGHGLGMCQYGADGMARAGGNATYILRHYYPHSRLKRAY
jgi:stage II sporulation protein D